MGEGLSVGEESYIQDKSKAWEMAKTENRERDRINSKAELAKVSGLPESIVEEMRQPDQKLTDEVDKTEKTYIQAKAILNEGIQKALEEREYVTDLENYEVANQLVNMLKERGFLQDGHGYEYSSWVVTSSANNRIYVTFNKLMLKIRVSSNL